MRWHNAAGLQHCALPDRQRWTDCGPESDCEQPACPGSLAELAAEQQPAVLPWQLAAWSHPRSAVQALGMASTHHDTDGLHNVLASASSLIPRL